MFVEAGVWKSVAGKRRTVVNRIPTPAVDFSEQNAKTPA
jgi:hypothetical protein